VHPGGLNGGRGRKKKVAKKPGKSKTSGLNFGERGPSQFKKKKKENIFWRKLIFILVRKTQHNNWLLPVEKGKPERRSRAKKTDSLETGGREGQGPGVRVIGTKKGEGQGD